MVRAKFVCDVSEGGEIAMRAVVGGSPENDEFFSYTPSGSLVMAIVNEETAAQFIPGREYYLDFTPAG